jgi:prolyl-tRNA synthetase
MAMPVMKGVKPQHDKFPGAVDTYTFESMMQDRKALQAGTSHFLGQNFAKAQDMTYLSADGQLEHCWTTSWGVSTRLVGGLIMTHSDDDGLIVPPRLAPAHVVILPITFKADDPEAVLAYCTQLADDLRKQTFAGRPIEVELDNRDMRGGDKTWQWVKKGVPIRLEVGQRDMAEDSVFMARRDMSPKEKTGVKRELFIANVAGTLKAIQDGLLEKAKAHRAEHTRIVNAKDKFYKFFTPAGGNTDDSGDDSNVIPIHGGFALAHWNGDEKIAEQVQKDLGVTIRCIPLEGELARCGFTDAAGEGKCIFTGEPSKTRVVWAKSY